MGTVGYVLFFGIMFWIMHKGGGCCGGHHGSSTAGQHSQGTGNEENNKSSNSNEVVEMVYDPVCGMHIEKNNSIIRRTSGEIYYFCSEECARNFVVDDDK
ncbi:YHS domain-containing protein [Sporohalobacter salinus]|uniref:YHS domain-containing protein n=1 Tax=Sporohalobacter salinus TaxID=1494606 RepID=UPI00195F6AD2|nr:YHS domain-containing protein [Sporohalobacter salinus]MBM7624703.1 YHS domain-containing protein [Sporohalobacter salinus]